MATPTAFGNFTATAQHAVRLAFTTNLRRRLLEAGGVVDAEPTAPPLRVIHDHVIPELADQLLAVADVAAEIAAGTASRDDVLDFLNSPDGLAPDFGRLVRAIQRGRTQEADAATAKAARDVETEAARLRQLANNVESAIRQSVDNAMTANQFDHAQLNAVALAAARRVDTTVVLATVQQVLRDNLLYDIADHRRSVRDASALAASTASTDAATNATAASAAATRRRGEDAAFNACMAAVTNGTLATLADAMLVAGAIRAARSAGWTATAAEMATFLTDMGLLASAAVRRTHLQNEATAAATRVTADQAAADLRKEDEAYDAAEDAARAAIKAGATDYKRVIVPRGVSGATRNVGRLTRADVEDWFQEIGLDLEVQALQPPALAPVVVPTDDHTLAGMIFAGTPLAAVMALFRSGVGGNAFDTTDELRTFVSGRVAPAIMDAYLASQTTSSTASAPTPVSAPAVAGFWSNHWGKVLGGTVLVVTIITVVWMILSRSR